METIERHWSYIESTENDAIRGEFAMLRAAALMLLNCDANAAFAEARTYAWSARDTRLQAELNCFEALRSLAMRELDVAEEHAAAAMTSSAPDMVAWGREITSQVAAARGKIWRQLDHLVLNLEYAASLEPRNVWLESRTLASLAILARDLHLPDIAYVVRQRTETLAWTPSTAALHFQTLRFLAGNLALGGDYVSASDLYARSAEVAPNLVWKTLAELDASFLARVIDQRSSAVERLESALALADGIDWSSVHVYERAPLLRLAEMTAPVDLGRARSYIAQYKALDATPAHDLRLDSEEQMRARESFSCGVVAKVGGEAGAAKELLLDSYVIWKRIEFSWRASLAACEVFELTREGEYLNYAKTHVRRVPNSWINGRVAQLAEEAPA